MAIGTYSDLKQAITDWFMSRSDLAANADDFIALAEEYFNLTLRCREMETVTTLTPVSNVCTLPTDYLEYKRVTALGSVRRKLLYITEDGADSLYPLRGSGIPNHFMIIGNSLTALPLATNNIELTYYQKIPSLSDDNPSNWLLARSSNLYLHMCLATAAEFVKDNDEMTKELGLVQTLVGALQDLDARSKFAKAGVTLSGPIY